MTGPDSSHIEITLPDGSTREVLRGTTARQIAEGIGPGLARAAVAAKVNGQVVDLGRPIEEDANVALLTEKNPEALDVLRHSAAHVLATAVRQVRPDAKIGFGPAIENGFYYDFEVDHPFTPEELDRIERQMLEVGKEDQAFERRVVSKAEARELFRDDPLKLERLEDLGPEETITVYRNGLFLDLCRGPHLPSTGRIRCVKLLNTAGAYWRGDEKRQMLQRIYGTAWFNEKDLADYLHRVEEAKRRDHRKLGKELDLYMVHPWAPGAAFWTGRGTIVYELLVDFMRGVLAGRGYEAVKTPLIFNKALWEQSGHWGKYRENMFLVFDRETGEADMSLKPMNCPSHFLLYARAKHSYRELPIRYSTQDVLHRNELTGALSGLTRVRQFQQDDAHIFIMESQIGDEVRRLVDEMKLAYGTFGLDYRIKFGTRPEVRVGSDELWDRAERDLRAALDTLDIPYEENPGDGAFYGPKVDFHVSDAIGRTWQLGTIQLDYNNPERFDLTYVGEDNAEHRPVVIHRAVFGSFERFIAILIEHFAGAFPFWLAPEQVRVVPIVDDVAPYARSVAADLVAAGFRVFVDDRSETLGYKIREGETLKVPYMAVVGKREAEEGTVAVRARGAGKKQEVVERAVFVAQLRQEAAERRY